MKSSSTTRKHSKKDLFDKYSCALCGDEDIYSGIIFKGHFVCEDCIEYVSSGTITEDGQIVFAEKEPQDKEISTERNTDSSEE